MQTMEKFNTDGKKESFRRLLLNQYAHHSSSPCAPPITLLNARHGGVTGRCQEEFEKEKKLAVLSSSEKESLTTDERDKVELTERKTKTRSRGNIIFIAVTKSTRTTVQTPHPRLTTMLVCSARHSLMKRCSTRSSCTSASCGL